MASDARTDISRPVSPLAEYLEGVLYTRWKADRQELEAKWEKNDCTIRKIRQENWKEGEGEDWRANNFVSVVKQKWLAGTALILDLILEGGQLGFGMRVNELGKRISQEELDQHSDQIEAAERAIRTEFETTRADRETIKAVYSAGKYGIAWGHYYTDTMRLRTYEPVEQRFDTGNEADQRFEETVREIDSPYVEYVPCYEMYWDMMEDVIEKMQGLCREQNFSAYQLRQAAKDGDGWIEEMIEDVIEEAKGSDSNGEGDESNVPIRRRNFQYRDKSIKYREYWTRVPVQVMKDFEQFKEQESLETLGERPEELDNQAGREVDVMVVTANHRVVRVVTLDEDEAAHKPFYMWYWEDSLDGEQGVSIADNGQELQEILNGAFNAYQDNKKLVGDVQGVYNPRFFPNEGDMTIEPGKFRPLNEAAKDLGDAFHQFVITDTSDAYLSVMNLAREMLDEETHIPKIAQGATGDIQKTAFETSQLVEKSGKYLGSVTRNVDNGWTEPIVNDFHRFNMLDPERTEGQGDFVASGKGFSSFQAKVERQQKLLQLLNLIMASPELVSMNRLLKIMEEIYKSMDIDPEEFLYSEEEAMQRAQALAQGEQGGDEDPEKDALDKQKTQVEIEQIQVDTEAEKADQMRKSEELKLKQAAFLAEQKDEQEG